MEARSRDDGRIATLGGVGRQNSQCCSGNAFSVNAGVVVDTMWRACRSDGPDARKRPAENEQQLMKLVPENQWTLFSHWLILAWPPDAAMRARLTVAIARLERSVPASE